MNKLLISGKKRLSGKVQVKSAKNAMLPLIASCILLDFEVGFLDCPKIKDVGVMLEIIENIGGRYRYEGDTLFVDCSSVYMPEIPCERLSKLGGLYFYLARYWQGFIKFQL